MNYATTSRPPLPQYDGQSLRPRRSAETAGHADLPPTEALPAHDAPSYRSRDFSPEGRRSASPVLPPSDGTVDFQTQSRDRVLAAAAPTPASSGIPEGTMTRRELRALRESQGIAAVPTDQTPIVSVPDRSLTAEPITQLPVAQQPLQPQPVTQEPVTQEPADEPVAQQPDVIQPVSREPEPIALVTPPPLIAPTPQPSSRLDSALAEFDALAAGRDTVAPAFDAPIPLPGRRAAQQPASLEGAPVEPSAAGHVPVEKSAVEQAPVEHAAEQVPAVLTESTDRVSAFDALFAVPQQAQPVLPIIDVQETAAPGAELPAPSSVEPTIEQVGGPAIAPLVEPEPAAAAVDLLRSAPAPQGAPASVPPPAAYPTPAYPTPADLPAPPPSGSAAPLAPASGPSSVGHWSTQSDIDDAEQVNESTISRDVGAGHGAITTSALVLPSSPDHAIGGPVGTGGEILLTGSISLPQSLSATGAHPSQLDESDLDHLLDPGDHQVANTDSTPVRAIRAVSTHTATGGIIAPHKPSGTRGFTILIIAAAAMAAVVVGLLVVGFVSGTI